MDNMRTIGLPSDIIAKCQIDIGILLHGICKAGGMTQGGATSLGLGKAKSVEFRTLAWKNPCSWPIKLHCNLGNSSEAFQNTKTHLNLVKLTEWSNFYLEINWKLMDFGRFLPRCGCSDKSCCNGGWRSWCSYRSWGSRSSLLQVTRKQHRFRDPNFEISM